MKLSKDFYMKKENTGNIICWCTLYFASIHLKLATQFGPQSLQVVVILTTYMTNTQVRKKN